MPTPRFTDTRDRIDKAPIRLWFASRILLRHPDHEPPNLGQHAATARPRLRIGPLPGDEPPMPAQQGVGGDNRRDGA